VNDQLLLLLLLIVIDIIDWMCVREAIDIVFNANYDIGQWPLLKVTIIIVDVWWPIQTDINEEVKILVLLMTNDYWETWILILRQYYY